MRETEDSQGVRRFADFPRPLKPLAVVPQLSPGAPFFLPAAFSTLRRSMSAPKESSSIEQLLSVMARLRDPARGCPWDMEQTFRTIAPYTIEEAYEVAEAIERGDMAALQDELGDLLLQVVFHARMAEEAGSFAFDDVVRASSTRWCAVIPMYSATSKFRAPRPRPSIGRI